MSTVRTEVLADNYVPRVSVSYIEVSFDVSSNLRIQFEFELEGKDAKLSSSNPVPSTGATHVFLHLMFSHSFQSYLDSNFLHLYQPSRSKRESQQMSVLNQFLVERRYRAQICGVKRTGKVY